MPNVAQMFTDLFNALIEAGVWALGLFIAILAIGFIIEFLGSLKR